MREQLADMRLEVETILLDRRFCEGLAFAYLRSAERVESSDRRHTHLAFAATNFRRAAAHATLLDDVASAKKLFSEAARVYARFSMPYSVMMSTLAGSIDEAQATFDEMLQEFTSTLEKAPPLLQRQWVYILLFGAVSLNPNRQQEFNVEGVLEGVRRELQASGKSPVGILGLPVATYLSLAVALAGSGDISPQEALLPFLSAYNDALRQASLNILHWGKMMLPFHPAEPDILSILVVSHLALKKRNGSVFQLLDGFPLAWPSRLILQGALKQRFPGE